MGGKGRRRREKNYRAAHGGYSRLPPPPNPSQVDALPSKLRKLISFTSSHYPKPQGSAAKDGDANKKTRAKGVSDPNGITDGGDNEILRTPQHPDSGDDTTKEKRKKKRKRNKVNDLRFETTLENSDARVKRRERKKKYLEVKKNKHKKAKTGVDCDFPGHEEIKFGEVVEAPPKLVGLPKAFKNVQGASQERIRLQAIEKYRNRKGWASRPGIQLPPATTSTAF
ncbi:uncharacterized protein LOC121262825 [Juglans microcarpa x Juglans regia]|uniref:uncharacterized protein LOC121262825 n=1 Tax=Juglans microcarpa x Juglans regia TaxID=2249226 RepID=UPI001B7ED73B|nr:uncharacterized protein LOC121262825 [Juglans microcarpa x Juglans regia]